MSAENDGDYELEIFKNWENATLSSLPKDYSLEQLEVGEVLETEYS